MQAHVQAWVLVGARASVCEFNYNFTAESKVNGKPRILSPVHQKSFFLRFCMCTSLEQTKLHVLVVATKGKTCIIHETKLLQLGGVSKARAPYVCDWARASCCFYFDMQPKRKPEEAVGWHSSSHTHTHTSNHTTPSPNLFTISTFSVALFHSEPLLLLLESHQVCFTALLLVFVAPHLSPHPGNS